MQTTNHEIAHILNLSLAGNIPVQVIDRIEINSRNIVIPELINILWIMRWFL